MNQTRKFFLSVAVLAGTHISSVAADEVVRGVTDNVISDEIIDEVKEKTSFLDRWHVLGYAELAIQRNFDRFGSHHAAPMGDYPAWRLNLPKACVWAEFDCGKGWVVGTQINP